MKNVFALAGMLVASLLASAALAQKTDPALKYAPSDPGGIVPKSGVIKSLRDCPVGTDAFFKNVSPFISGGPGGAEEYFWEGVFPVDGSEVTLNVFWKDDNSYRFQAFGGVVWAIGPEIDSDKLIYESDPPVFADGGHNVLLSGDDSAAVNHLDVCLSLVDTTPPVIEFIEPLDGDTVSGTVTVIVTATDESGVDVTVSVNDGTPVPMTCTLEADDQYRCTYDWLTTEPGEELPAGTYTITVEAKDGAEPVQNTTTATITVELVNSLTDCFGILGPEDFGGDPDPDGFANGCEPTPLANVQAPPDTGICNVQIPPSQCFLAGRQLKPNPDEYATAASTYGFVGRCDSCALDYCGNIAQGQYGIPDPRMYCDGTLDLQTGECKDNLGDEAKWIPVEPLVPLFVKDVAEGDPELVLGKYVYGYKGCFAGSQHVRGGTSIVDLYDYWPQDPATGLVFIKTHRPANVIPPDLVAACNFGEADAAQAGYQPILKNQSVDRLEDGTTPAITLAATQKCVNPPRTLSRDNGIDVSNIIETDGSDDPLAFKYQMAQMQFDALYAALDCAEPTFLRGRIKFSDVSSPINQAQAQFSNGSIAALERARDDLQDAALAIREANWDVTAENCAGDALARTENLAWRMTDLIAAPRP